MYLTLLLTPSAVPKVAEELASPSLSHVHQPLNAHHPGSASLVDRLQVVPVTRGDGHEGEHLDLGKMLNEAADFADALPGFLRSLFSQADFTAGPKPLNKFAALKPDFLLASVRGEP